VRSRSRTRFLWLALTAASSFWAASCAVALGPGYTIEKQEIRVRFVSTGQPRIQIEGDYSLKNTGNRPLRELELRLPGRRRFHYENPSITWEGKAVTPQTSADNPRDTLIILPEPWKVSARRNLHLSVEYSPPAAGEAGLSFSNEAFFLPAAGWSADLLPPEGLFASGGVPPKKWDLLVAVRNGFQIHTSGLEKKSAQKGGETVVLAEQGTADPYPFVIAGRYHSAEIGAGKEKLHLWTSQPQESAKLREASEALKRVIAAYDAAFGERSRESSQIWIVECPVVAGCFTSLNPLRARLLGQEENERTTAEMISQDSVVVDLSGGAVTVAAAAAPSLAASWLGYAQNPGFYEQRPPLTMLPVFAAAIGRDAAEGADSRGETIRRVLHLVPVSAKPHQEEDANVLRAKSFLFFYALQDRYGKDVFRKATQHMLYARRGKGFELSDLIAAFEQETHQNVAEFVRMWMKRPGVPEEFRARYETTAAATAVSNKENTP
jgi:hypothetical protein